MGFLKKFLFPVLFPGVVSPSLCEEGKPEEDEKEEEENPGENGENREKGFFGALIPAVAGAIGGFFRKG
uniref:Antimicrobial peptide hylin-Pul4 n=1 Tax=Boana pulchella TaxID=280005 RepID=A0A977QKT2_9NEOB|nr:antimicrobial peptide hylin-Pul4 [Boana pulchella]